MDAKRKPCPFCGCEVSAAKLPQSGITMFHCNNGRCGALITFRGPKPVRNGFTEAARPERNFNRRYISTVEVSG